MSNTKISLKSLPSVLALLVSAALLAGCGDNQNEEAPQSGETTGESPQMIERQAPQKTTSAQPGRAEAETGSDSTDFTVVPDFEGQLEEDGLGLDTIIDASSKQAYADSMAWIAEDVSPQQYNRLERSLRYIRTYDSSVLGSEERFLQVIDGKTGQELIERANKLNERQRQ